MRRFAEGSGQSAGESPGEVGLLMVDPEEWGGPMTLLAVLEACLLNLNLTFSTCLKGEKERRCEEISLYSQEINLFNGETLLFTIWMLICDTIRNPKFVENSEVKQFDYCKSDVESEISAGCF